MACASKPTPNHTSDGPVMEMVTVSFIPSTSTQSHKRLYRSRALPLRHRMAFQRLAGSCCSVVCVEKHVDKPGVVSLSDATSGSG